MQQSVSIEPRCFRGHVSVFGMRVREARPFHERQVGLYIHPLVRRGITC